MRVVRSELIDIVKIHFSPYPLSTGASLFTFIHAPISSASSSQTSTDISQYDNATVSAESSFGMTLYTPLNGPIWEYSKDEDPALLTPRGAADAGMDYVVLGANEMMGGGWVRDEKGAGSDAGEGKEGEEGKEGTGWKIVQRIQGYDG
jgi:alpha-1,6-mannosyltransferase